MKTVTHIPNYVTDWTDKYFHQSAFDLPLNYPNKKVLNFLVRTKKPYKARLYRGINGYNKDNRGVTSWTYDRQIAERYAKDRPISIGMVGHSWNLDALATYLANDGKVTPEGFEKIGGKLIGETQLGKIEIPEDAAIISRELKKPCIIGTRIATKVLKDGDLVEVDANKGIVRIIKVSK